MARLCPEIVARAVAAFWGAAHEIRVPEFDKDARHSPFIVPLNPLLELQKWSFRWGGGLC